MKLLQNRVAYRILLGRCPMPQGQFYRMSVAWGLRQRLTDTGAPAWGYPQIARHLGFRDTRAAAIAVALHDVYMIESTAAEIARRQSQYRPVPGLPERIEP